MATLFLTGILRTKPERVVAVLLRRSGNAGQLRHSARELLMTYNDSLIVDHIHRTHATDVLSEREKHLVGLAVTMTRGCQVCTRNRIEKARGIGLTDDELNALIAVTAAVNSGVTGATARVAFGMLDDDSDADCGETCSPESTGEKG